MNPDGFGALAVAVLEDAALQHHLREAPDATQFWERLELLARERDLHPDFEILRADANGALAFWWNYWSHGVAQGGAP